MEGHVFKMDKNVSTSQPNIWSDVMRVLACVCASYCKERIGKKIAILIT